MKRKKLDLVAWFAAVILSLLLALWASVPARDGGNAKVPVITIKESTIASIELVGRDVSVAASRQRDVTDRWWISFERKPVSDPEGKSQEAVVQDRFMTSAKFKELIAQFSPLQALRVIGEVADDKLSEFGLKDSGKTLILKDASGVELLSLKIGKQLYGARSMYVLNQQDHKVLLIAGELISDFEKPELRFFERAITSIDLEEIQAATLTQGSKTRRFGHTTKDAKGTLLWTADAAKETPVPQASSWFDRFMLIKAASYASKEDEASLAAAPVLFDVRLEGSGATTEVLQLKRRSGAGGPEFWIYSSYLNWHVKVAATRAETLQKDVSQILQD
jgi:hypothetical protein